MIDPRRVGRRVAAAIVAVVLIAGGGALYAGASAGATARRPLQQPSREIGLELVAQHMAFAADGDLRIRYRLVGDLSAVDALSPPTTTTTTTTIAVPAQDDPLADVPPPVDLNVVVVNYEPLAPGDDPSRYIGVDARTARLATPIDGVVLANGRDLLEFAEDGTVTIDLTVGTDSGESVEDLIKFDEPGLYPIVVSLVVGSGEEADVLATYGTIVQRLPGAGDIIGSSAPIDLAIAAAIDEIGPEPTAAEVSRTQREINAALALTTAIESPVTLSIPPLVLQEAVRRAPVALGDRLQGDRLVSVAATPLDVSSAAAAGITDAFARQLREGEDLLTAAVPTSVARRDVWIATEPLSSTGAQVVRDLGYRFVVMTPTMFEATVDVDLPGPNATGPDATDPDATDPDATDPDLSDPDLSDPDLSGTDLPGTDLFVEIELPDGGTLPLLVVDALGAQLTKEATDEILDDATAVEWAVGTIADMILDQDRGSRFVNRSRILSTPELTAPDPRLLAALETLVKTTPSIRFTEAGNLPGVTDVRRAGGDDVMVRLPDTAGIDLSERLLGLDAAAVAMLSVGSMLPADDPRPGDWSSRISELVSTGYSQNDVDSTIATLLGEAERLKGSVIPPEPFTFTLTGRSGDIELRVSNRADEPLKVLVRLSSSKLAFPDGDQLVELRPNEQTLIAVPVRARTNGVSGVVVELLTPAGEAIHEPVVLTSRVNALTGFGQVLTAGLFLVLLTWWFSHWRARRREAAAANAGEVMDRHPSNGK